MDCLLSLILRTARLWDNNKATNDAIIMSLPSRVAMLAGYKLRRVAAFFSVSPLISWLSTGSIRSVIDHVKSLIHEIATFVLASGQNHLTGDVPIHFIRSSYHIVSLIFLHFKSYPSMLQT